MSVKSKRGRGVGFSRSRRKPPASLSDYALSRGYCSVTDLVSPVWCEYAFQYNLLGMSHLSLSERPSEIATPQGNIVKPNIEIAQKRDKVLKSGREVHRRLEKEIHPVRVYVETKTEEDDWGLRLLQLITGLRVLMKSGCCRELPVFGIIEGTLVFGVIDEVRIHHEKEVNGSPKKLYSSQEEWKKKAASQQKKNKVESNQRSLAAFMPGIKNVAVVEEKVEEEGSSGVFGFVLEDAKTRLSMSMPEPKDQIQSKLQCMLYKRLLEGLIGGLASDTQGARLDMNATPITSESILAYLDLKGDVALSEVFMKDAEELCQSFQLSLRVEQDGQGRWTCTLAHLFAILATTFDQLIDMARKGAINKNDFPVIQDELRLTYRRRGGGGGWQRRKERKNRDSQSRSQPLRKAKEGNGDLRNMLQAETNIEDLDEEAQVELALQVSLGDTQKEEEEEKLADHSIAMPSSPEKVKTKDVIIGTARFLHDSQQLQDHIIDVMAMWKGKRPLRGVTVEQTWRCNHCEYQVDCEWRALKAEEGFQRAREKREAEEDEAMWSQVDELPKDMEW